MTKIATLVLINGELKETNVEYVNFNDVPSNDPMAYFFGKKDAKSGKNYQLKQAKNTKN